MIDYFTSDRSWSIKLINDRSIDHDRSKFLSWSTSLQDTHWRGIWTTGICMTCEYVQWTRMLFTLADRLTQRKFENWFNLFFMGSHRSYRNLNPSKSQFEINIFKAEQTRALLVLVCIVQVRVKLIFSLFNIHVLILDRIISLRWKHWVQHSKSLRIVVFKNSNNENTIGSIAVACE